MSERAEKKSEEFTMPMAVACVGMALAAVAGLLGVGYLNVLAAATIAGCR